MAAVGKMAAPVVKKVKSPEQVIIRQTYNQKQVRSSSNVCGTSNTNIGEKYRCTPTVTLPHQINKDTETQSNDLPALPRRTRVKWTREMNFNVVKSYLRAVHTTPSTIRKGMHKYWKEIYPTNGFTEQRICDQRRIIYDRASDNRKVLNVRGHWLANEEIHILQQEADIMYTQVTR